MLNDSDLVITDFGLFYSFQQETFLSPNINMKPSGYFKPPEYHLKTKYDGVQCDLFASAMILFIMVSGHPPFITAQPTDAFYRCIARNRIDIFWKTHSKNKSEGLEFYSDEFKELFGEMVSLDPTLRPSMSEII